MLACNCLFFLNLNSSFSLSSHSSQLPSHFVRHETFFQIKLAIKDEVEYLEKAGINVIQIDEAALGVGLPLRKLEHAFYMDWAVHSFRITNCGVQDTTKVSITFLFPCSGKLFQVLWL
ncbi:unnamed protein product [Linum trigynum]|uniref:Cobalamin-independent methionine synthase MetE C-terminal/archaeal domain-containing protein n=1 Tax=Linum trigynum TaxID=586398 RepID=A0AAV2DJU8_9ROSI